MNNSKVEVFAAIWSNHISEVDGERHYDFYSEAINAFSEHIVRECSEVIQHFADCRIPASEYSERLKLHFGINSHNFPNLTYLRTKS